MDLFSPVTALKGVGAVRAKQLAKLHIETLYDLIAFFPRDYEDRTKLCSIAGLKPGEPACFEAMVISNPQLSRIRKGMELVKVRVADETGRVDLVFFNQPYVKDQLNYGESYRFYGALREGYGHHDSGQGHKNNQEWKKPLPHVGSVHVYPPFRMMLV